MRFLLILITTSLLTLGSLKGQSPQIDTEYGPIVGSKIDEVYEFLGIPFATPPTGELRWRNPQPPQSWSTPILTQEYGPKCPQKSFSQGDTTAVFEGNEDCLYLNIWTPDTAQVYLPVMVFIHGGGNQQGSASQIAYGTELYYGKNMSERGQVVVVTIQYRLGPLGFLVHPGLEPESSENTSGNYAVMDQILALEWIQDNIVHFGGDPERVMIFGESAGAVNVGNLMTTPMAADLFSRAAIQSGSPNLQTYEDGLEYGLEYADNLNASGSNQEQIAFLRGLSAEELLAGIESPLSGGFVQSKWKPTLDNYIFTDTPLNIIQSGDFNKVPLIIGSNADEMSLSSPPVVTEAMVDALINLFIPLHLRPLAQELYYQGNAKMTYIQMLTDAQFTTPARRIARCISQNQEEPVFRYFFTYPGTPGNFGAYHGIELIYLFNNFENSSLGGTPLHTIQDDSVQMNMLNYWVNFAYSGSPNDAEMENWPIYDSGDDCYLEIKPTPDGSQCELRRLKSNLWDAVVNFPGCTSAVNNYEVERENDNWQISPNPTTGIFTLQSTNKAVPFEVAIFNPAGHIIKKYSNHNYYDLADLPNGLYFLNIKTRDGFVTKKIVKQ